MPKIVDLHCDTVWRIEQARVKREKMHLRKSNFQVDGEKLLAGGYFAQCFAVFTPNEFKNPYEKCLRAIDLYSEFTETFSTLNKSHFVSN